MPLPLIHYRKKLASLKKSPSYSRLKDNKAKALYLSTHLHWTRKIVLALNVCTPNQWKIMKLATKTGRPLRGRGRPRLVADPTESAVVKKALISAKNNRPWKAHRLRTAVLYLSSSIISLFNISTSCHVHDQSVRQSSHHAVQYLKPIHTQLSNGIQKSDCLHLFVCLKADL